MTSINAIANAGQTGKPGGPTGRDYSTLGQADFLRLLTVQVQQQDPFAPVDNKEMLAQMAQFSSLAGINDVNSNLQQMLEKLDLLVAAQAASIPTSDAKE